MQSDATKTWQWLGRIGGSITWICSLVLSSVAILIVGSHNLAPESNRLLTSLSFIQPIYVFVLVIPAAVLLILKKRRTWALTLTLLTLANIFWNEDYHLFKGSPVSLTQAKHAEVRVLAWNIQGFYFGIPRIAATIRNSGADILLLSEVTLKPHELGVFQKAIRPYRALLSEQGDVAILTKLPILEAHEVELPSRQASLTRHNRIEDQQHNPARSFLHANLQVGTRTLDVLSIRFIAGRARSEGFWDSLRWGLYLWEQQDREVQFFADYVRHLKDPYIFGGDLNAPPASRTMKIVDTLGRDTFMNQHRWGMFTYKTKILPSSKEKNLPVMRLDYIYSSQELLIGNARRLDVNLSDHYPIESVLGFPDKQQLPIAEIDTDKLSERSAL